MSDDDDKKQYRTHWILNTTVEDTGGCSWSSDWEKTDKDGNKS